MMPILILVSVAAGFAAGILVGMRLRVQRQVDAVLRSEMGRPDLLPGRLGAER